MQKAQDSLSTFLLFPGHGSERPGMTRGLYKNVDSYRTDLDRCLDTANKLISFDLRRILFPEQGSRETNQLLLSQTEATQPALFIVEYCLAKLLERSGVESDGMLGHSVSEYVAACLAGVFDLQTALEIVIKRGELVQSVPKGAMLAVALPEGEIKPHLSDRIDLGSTLGENQCVLSGYADAISELEERLTSGGVECKMVKVTRAFHSMMLDPVVEAFGNFLAGKKLNQPQKRFISGIDGKWIDDRDATSPDYWVKQLRSPVRLYEGISTLVESSPALFLEVGKGNMLTNLVRGHSKTSQDDHFLSTVPSAHQDTPDEIYFDENLQKIRQIRAGADIRGKGSETSFEDLAEWSLADLIEFQVDHCFCQTLGLSKIERGQNFIELGGNSLMAMKVISGLRGHLEVDLKITEFFQNPTVADITTLILKKKKRSDDPRTKGDALSVKKKKGIQKDDKQGMRFSLFFFSGDQEAYPGDRYKLVMEASRFADENGFEAIWLPERHFNKFGGLYPNPSVLGAAIAATTRNVHVRGGSVVAPLHHPIRISEEWSVLDNLSKGRVGVAFGSGFHPKDFIFAPQDFKDRKNKMFKSIRAIRELWRGGSFTGPSGLGDETVVSLFPTPYSEDLPMWLSTTRSPDTFREAGENGTHVLTALLRLSKEELEERIALYRESLTTAGNEIHSGIVSLMLHTFVGEDEDYVRSKVEGPLKAYLRSHMEHTEAVSTEKAGGEAPSLSSQEEEELLDHAFNR